MRKLMVAGLGAVVTLVLFVPVAQIDSDEVSIVARDVAHRIASIAYLN